MGRRRQRGRDLSGMLLLDKPAGMTSNAALQQVKRIYQAAKAGHTGSLDPLATGLLPLCFGEATKISAYLLDADKRYWVRIRLGENTTTQDAEGEVTERRPTDGITRAAVEQTLERFRGEIEQLPPMYSAVKHKGERLYKLAREGREVEREPRRVRIHRLELGAFEPPELELTVHCSKGTYVRTLAEDLGNALGCGAHVIALRRTGVGPYDDSRLVSLDELRRLADQAPGALDGLLLPVESAVADWPEVALTEDAAFYMRQGQPVLVPKAPTSGWVRLTNSRHQFLGVGQILDDGRVAPKRLLQSGP